MPRRNRCVLPDVPCHITQRGVDRCETFSEDQDRLTYRRLVQENLQDAGVRILGYCLMTNHVHLIAVPSREDSLSILARRVHGRYAQYYNARSGRSGHVWQNRFFGCMLGAVPGLLKWMEKINRSFSPQARGGLRTNGGDVEIQPTTTRFPHPHRSGCCCGCRDSYFELPAICRPSLGGVMLGRGTDHYYRDHWLLLPGFRPGNKPLSSGQCLWYIPPLLEEVSCPLLGNPGFS